MGRAEIVDEATEDEKEFVDHERCVTSVLAITSDSTGHRAASNTTTRDCTAQTILPPPFSVMSNFHRPVSGIAGEINKGLEEERNLVEYSTIHSQDPWCKQIET